MATGLAIASLVIGTASAAYSGAAQSAAASRQAAAAQYEAESQSLSAKYAAAQLTKEKSRAKQSQIAAAAAAGLDVSSTTIGSLLDTTEKSYQDKIDNTLLSGQMALARGSASSSAYRAQGASALTGGLVNAGATILSGTTAIGKAQGWKGFTED